MWLGLPGPGHALRILAEREHNIGERMQEEKPGQTNQRLAYVKGQLTTTSMIVPWQHDFSCHARKSCYLSMNLNAEIDMDYPNYIGSSAWRRSPARLKVLAEAAGHCRLCHAEARLEVHHATYERLGCECDTDLIPICRDCHRDVTSFLRARRYAVAVPRRADAIRLSDTRVVSNDPTAGGY
jgi:hypothetical protein